MKKIKAFVMTLFLCTSIAFGIVNTPIVEAKTPTVTASSTKKQANALKEAKQYLKFMAFSRQGLIDQLSSPYGENFSVADATYAVDKLEADKEVDWNEQAVRAAKSYTELMKFSKEGLINQLSGEYGAQYTKEQAEYAVKEIGY